LLVVAIGGKLYGKEAFSEIVDSKKFEIEIKILISYIEEIQQKFENYFSNFSPF